MIFPTPVREKHAEDLQHSGLIKSGKVMLWLETMQFGISCFPMPNKKFSVSNFSSSKWGIPWMGYLVPARDGSGLLPDRESSWDVVAAAVAAATWKFRLTFRLGKYTWSFQIGFWLTWEIFGLWDRGSTQNFELDLSSRVIWSGKPFWKTCLCGPYFKNICSCYWKNNSTKHFSPKSSPKSI